MTKYEAYNRHCGVCGRMIRVFRDPALSFPQQSTAWHDGQPESNKPVANEETAAYLAEHECWKRQQETHERRR